MLTITLWQKSNGVTRSRRRIAIQGYCKRKTPKSIKDDILCLINLQSVPYYIGLSLPFKDKNTQIILEKPSIFCKKYFTMALYHFLKNNSFFLHFSISRENGNLEPITIRYMMWDSPYVMKYNNAELWICFNSLVEINTANKVITCKILEMFSIRYLCVSL